MGLHFVKYQQDLRPNFHKSEAQSQLPEAPSQVRMDLERLAHFKLTPGFWVCFGEAKGNFGERGARRLVLYQHRPGRNQHRSADLMILQSQNALEGSAVPLEPWTVCKQTQHQAEGHGREF